MEVMKKYKVFIGVDVGKASLDICALDASGPVSYRKIDNNVGAIGDFIQELKTVQGFKIAACVFGMEQTGFYCNHLLSVLVKNRANIVQENPVQIKNSLGLLRGKDDKLDSLRIASYLFKSREKLVLWQPKRDILLELSGLLTLRERLCGILRVLKVPLKEEQGFISKKKSLQHVSLCSATLSAAGRDKDLVEARIRSLWSADEQLKNLMDIITSVPCIGELTSLHILIATNEFRNISAPKKFACYAGVAPFPFKSGTSVLRRTRVSHIANKKMKALLQTCAMLSVRFVPEMKAYFVRKTEIEKKHKMLVYNAIRSKLILRVFACVRQQRAYQKNWQPQGSH